MKKQTKTAAVLTINDAAKWTARGRKRVACWLIQQAKFLVNHGKDFSGTFRARYIY